MAQGNGLVNRRNFLLSSVGLLSAFALSLIPGSRRKQQKRILFSGAIVGPSYDLGHRLLKGDFPKPARERKVPVVIVGAGISGLSAGWKLSKTGFQGFEILELEPEEERRFRQELDTGPSGLQRLAQEAFGLLDLITFYTIVGTEVRAWTLRRGDSIHQAAGKIHSDIQRGFIRAEVVKFNDFVEAGSEEKAREAGLTRIEGRDYLVQDGDLVRIRFH